MHQQNDEYKIPYHYVHIQNMLRSILKQMSTKYETLMLTKRTAQIVFSILSEAQIASCGFKKIILPSQINPYMEYQEIVLALTLSSNQDFQEVSQISHKIDKVSILHLGLCTQQSKSLFKKLEFKQGNSIRGFKQENLDFFCYLHNTYILTTRGDSKDKQIKQNKQKKGKNSQLPLRSAIDRLCSFLCSYQSFSQFQFYLPKKNQEAGKVVKEILQKKLAILSKYNYKHLSKNQGISSIKTKVIFIQRSQQVSPFILSLFYGPLAEQLRLGNACRFVSIHSSIYNTLYDLDLLKASEQLLKIAEDLSSSKQQKLNTINLTETKKVLNKAYNSDLSKQELQFHQSLLKEINEFMKKNIDLLALQQSIGNKIDQQGQPMSGSRIVKEVMKWCQQNQSKYERYLGLILLALAVHSFWWYQKNQLISGVNDKQDLQGIQKYLKKCKQKYSINSLIEKAPTKDNDGVEVRQKCFRHYPSILKEFVSAQQQIQQKKLRDYQILKINSGQVESMGKKTRTIVYINSTIGYNELAMLLALKRPSIDFVCLNLKTTTEWVQHTLQSS